MDFLRSNTCFGHWENHGMAVGDQAGLPEELKPGNLPVSIEERPPAHLLTPAFSHFQESLP